VAPELNAVAPDEPVDWEEPRVKAPPTESERVEPALDTATAPPEIACDEPAATSRLPDGLPVASPDCNATEPVLATAEGPVLRAASPVFLKAAPVSSVTRPLFGRALELALVAAVVTARLPDFVNPAPV
jgi:hypothetical protein